MKKCDEILELLSLYIDKELDDERVKMVQEHVEACSSCKSELEQLYEVVKLCNDVDEVELPEGFKDVLHQRLNSEKQNIDDGKKILIMRSRIMKTITSVAAVVLVVFAVRGFLNIGINNKTAEFYTDSKNSVSLHDNLDKEKTDNNSGSMVQNGAEDQWGNAISGAEKDEVHSKENSKEETSSKRRSFKDEADSNSTSYGIYSSITADEEVKPSNATSDLTVTYDIPKGTDGDKEVDIQFNKDPDASFTQSSEPYGWTSTEKIICFNIKSENIEEDKMKLEGIAGKFGTKTDGSVVGFEDKVTVKFCEPEIQRVPDFTVSYSIDKSNYDAFANEIEKSFSGKYKVTSDEEQLKIRLKDLEDNIAKLENENTADGEKLKILQEERESIFKQLDNINSSSKIKVTVTISPA